MKRACGWMALLLLSACGTPAVPPREPQQPDRPEPEIVFEPAEVLAGGDTTVFVEGPDAFRKGAANLGIERKSRFLLGEANFDVDWVRAPHAKVDRDGLGPLFHATSCLACHAGNGRGSPVREDGSTSESLLIRLSVPGRDVDGAPLPDPVYGGQFQPRGNDAPPEGTVLISWREREGTLGSGEAWTLVEPSYALVDLGYGPLHPQVRLSPRIAPPMHGLGLLAALSEETLAEWADPDDEDGDGISGRPNQVYSIREGRRVMGRFGWKANEPDLAQQVAGALHGDMGLTSPLRPEPPCTSSQTACLAAPNGGHPEVDEANFSVLVDHSHLLAVPARRGADQPEVLEGKKVFHQRGCAGCHRPSMVTGTLEGYPELSNQLIWPYSDLLLHDLGPGLADRRADHEATGREWQTPPLWGLGLTATVSGHTRLLHDGRARSVTEAILWHGGEAERAREGFRALSREEREALLTFLDSL